MPNIRGRGKPTLAEATEVKAKQQGTQEKAILQDPLDETGMPFPYTLIYLPLPRPIHGELGPESSESLVLPSQKINQQAS